MINILNLRDYIGKKIDYEKIKNRTNYKSLG